MLVIAATIMLVRTSLSMLPLLFSVNPKPRRPLTVQPYVYAFLPLPIEP